MVFAIHCPMTSASDVNSQLDGVISVVSFNRSATLRRPDVAKDSMLPYYLPARV
jgi:hypothetical protein